MIKETFEVSGVVAPRARYEVLASLMEEVGELATEVAVREGYSNKYPGPDGIMGECIDVITCALDLIWLDQHEYYDKETLKAVVMDKLNEKLAKWKEKKAK
jgi:hypothetical protein